MLSKLLWAILAFKTPPSLAQMALGPKGGLIISNIDASPDGFTRPVIAVNGQHPSPLIRATKGDDFKLTVVNRLQNPTMLRQTSIHWHGIFQYQSAWADGADGVTQCPIPQNGESFTYGFNAGQEAGTYWYHSHFGTQYCDDPHRGLYDVDNTLMAPTRRYHLQTPSITGMGAPMSDATLINGKGRTPGGPKTPVEIIKVKQGIRYRLRLVSLSCDPNYRFSIDGHNLTIIETDGQPTEPHTVQELQIFAGQRYSVVLEANQAPSNYWIRAIPNLGSNNLTDYSEGGINSAILRADLRSLLDPAAPGGSGPADENIVFNIGLTDMFTMNGASWTSPDSPVLVQIMNGVPAADLVPAGALRTLPRNAVVEVSIPGFEIAGPRDVVNIGGANDNVTIRFTTDNPGPWFFHCHIEFHLVMYWPGMVFVEAPEDIASNNKPPVEWSKLSSATEIQIVPTPTNSWD
ncbi:laccase 10 [Coprinopsis sp. MPI-PUGE-AT-0042]|nr:laccase 10 [Coprinopsis sp. MPI-PUGE-AT-0042]